MSETQNPDDTARFIYLVQEDLGIEGQSNIVACPTREAAEALAARLGATRRFDSFVVEEVPLAVDLASTIREVLTVNQAVLSDGSLGDYTETRRSIWSFDKTTTPVAPVTKKALASGVEITGTDHAAVRAALAEWMSTISPS